MRHPDLPTAGQRLDAAKVAGEVQRIAFGDLRGLDLEAAVARLHAITTDAVVLGHELGSQLVHAERSRAYEPAVRMLRAAGADEKTAKVKAEWLREQYRLGRML